MQQQILSFLMKDDDITWKAMLQDIVEQEGMDPWDIDITVLTQEYIKLIKEMKEHDLRISGKVLLAAAILLKMKSAYFINNDISNLDKLLLNAEKELDEEFDEELLSLVNGQKSKERPSFALIPRNPQPRDRKVSINDLVEALQRAMASKKRFLAKQRPVKFMMPLRKIDIMEAINDTYQKIIYYSNKEGKKRLEFTKLVPAKAGKMEKVFTFLPLLHLENQQKIETEQEKPFDEIYVKLKEQKKIVSAE